MIKLNTKEQLATNPNYSSIFIRFKGMPMQYVIDKAAVENVINVSDKDFANVTFYSNGVKVEMKSDYELIDFDITQANNISAVNNLAEEWLIDNHPDFAGGVIA
jgi:hypothetical protein